MALYPPSQPYHWTFRRVMWATLVLVLVVLGFWLLYRFNQVIFILFIAIVMGTVIRPLVTRLHQRGLPRMAGVILVSLLLLALLIGFVLLLFPLIVEQGATIVAAAPGYYQNLRAWMAHYPNQLIVRLGEFLPVTLPGLTPTPQTGPQMLASASHALGYVRSAAKIIFTAIVILLLAFHWTLNGPRTIQSLLLLVPKNHRESFSELVSAMESKVGFYIAGQGVLCLVIGVMALIAYLIIGLPNALVLALVAGVLEAVPMVGPLLGAVPAAVIALSISPSKLIWVIVATMIIQQLENSLLVPRVMRRAVGVNPFVSLLAFFAFSSLLGIAGALMAIPMAAILQLLLDRFVFHPTAMEPEVTAGRDYASRLRYEAQDLAQDLRKQARLQKGGTDLRVKQIDQVMDEIETITTDLDALLAQVRPVGAT
ncbi:AI-2E family transporter [Candidatus Amarolinea aalborgensis]|uniref:AI-2E family transporter n=1 Tax=Candidatus Amarolinea aalborgensis TaxID=2249329 RepID=UPI003BF9E9C7